ncbi:putative reverse transcriptase domain-containing protein [Tanacetum coccineum]
MSKVLQERGFGSLPSLTETNPRDEVKSISTTIKADSHSIRHIGSSQYAVSTAQNRASVSVMPLLTYLNLRLGELAHTRLTVELADRTVKYPKGIAENILVRIGKFTFLVDFIILDMAEDIKVPLILGRPFLSTARAKIDVYKRKSTLRVKEEKIIFKSVKPAILEDMGAYRDKGMGDVIVSEPFLREVGIKARRFDGMITIYNGNDEVSEHDKMNGISHSYQKLKRFYKRVLNLGFDFIRVPSMEEWLTRRHVSVHEME